MKKTKKPLPFRLAKGAASLFYKKRNWQGLENLPQEPCVIVGNHAQIHGPLCFELYYPRKKNTWCVSDMMSAKAIPSYAMQDFWAEKPAYVRWIFRLGACLLSPIAAYLFRKADAIPVGKDAELLSTFRKTLSSLDSGSDIVIFPEGRTPFNTFVNDFHQNFVDVARFYYKRYGKRLSFVPCYSAPKIKTVCLGEPIVYNPEKDADVQRVEICEHLKAQITLMAKELPRHKVVPYDNVGKKNYVYSK